MMSWWHYLLLVNLYLVLFFSFYRVFLHRETFFQLNRLYLVAGSLLSFLIPVMQSDWIRRLFITQRVHQTIYATVNPQLIYEVKPVESNPLTLGQIFAAIYIAGAVLLMAKLVYQLLSIKKLADHPNAPAAFSFFGKIRVDESLPAQQTILEHEQVHTRQWHSADVLLIEAVMIINWFNPVVYFYRKAIKRVHEYIADRKAIETGTSKTEYALLLLSQTFGTQPHQLTNNFFNNSLLKQRIMMLNQNESRRRALLKYGLSAPLFAAMLVFSSATVNNSKLIKVINKKTDQAFSINTIQIKASLKDSAASNTSTVTALQPGNATARSSIVDAATVKPAISIALQTSAGHLHKDSAEADHSPVFNAVEINPNFPGGEEGFGRFLRDNIHYPEKAKANNIQGRVFIQFVVEKDGSLSDMKTLRDPGDGLGAEAERVLSISPKWQPGIQNGKPVRVQYTVPVNFSMVDDVEKKKSVDTVHVDFIPRKQNLKLSFTYNQNKTDSVTHVPINMTYLNGAVIKVNGRAVTKEQLRSIDANFIQSVRVIKGDSSANKGEKSRGTILIKTKDTKPPQNAKNASALFKH